MHSHMPKPLEHNSKCRKNILNWQLACNRWKALAWAALH